MSALFPHFLPPCLGEGWALPGSSHLPPTLFPHFLPPCLGEGWDMPGSSHLPPILFPHFLLLAWAKGGHCLALPILHQQKARAIPLPFISALFLYELSVHLSRVMLVAGIGLGCFDKGMTSLRVLNIRVIAAPLIVFRLCNHSSYYRV